jgi:hypothetical protein
MKKFLILLIAIGLVFSAAMLAKAEYKRAYFEYKKEENINKYGPKCGFNWGINDRWSVFSSYECNGNEESSLNLGIERALLHRSLLIGLGSEIADPKNSYNIYLANYADVNKTLAINGRITYTSYFPHGIYGNNPDYSELKFSGGTTIRLNEAWAAFTNCNLTRTDVDQRESENKKDWELSGRLEYHLTRNLRVAGYYEWEKTIYDNDLVNDLRGNVVDKSALVINYNFKKYEFYLWYEIPARNNAATLGVSYYF